MYICHINVYHLNYISFFPIPPMIPVLGAHCIAFLLPFALLLRRRREDLLTLRRGWHLWLLCNDAVDAVWTQRNVAKLLGTEGFKQQTWGTSPAKGGFYDLKKTVRWKCDFLWWRVFWFSFAYQNSWINRVWANKLRWCLNPQWTPCAFNQHLALGSINM